MAKSATALKYLEEFLNTNKPTPVSEVKTKIDLEYETLADIPEGRTFKSGNHLQYILKTRIMRHYPPAVQWVIIKETTTGAEKHQFPTTAPGSIRFQVVWIEAGERGNKRQVATLS